MSVRFLFGEDVYHSSRCNCVRPWSVGANLLHPDLDVRLPSALGGSSLVNPSSRLLYRVVSYTPVPTVVGDSFFFVFTHNVPITKN